MFNQLLKKTILAVALMSVTVPAVAGAGSFFGGFLGGFGGAMVGHAIDNHSHHHHHGYYTSGYHHYPTHYTYRTYPTYHETVHVNVIEPRKTVYVVEKPYRTGRYYDDGFDTAVYYC